MITTETPAACHVFNDLTHKRKGDVDIVTHQDRPQGDKCPKETIRALINRCTFVT